jgi:chromate reductase, NAD(P)H dehydrogenase (quinone)
MNPIAPIRIAGISGSLRQASFSTALIKLLARHLQPAIELSLVDIRDVPLYNEDLDDDNKPAAVHGVPGVLKNTLDWISRRVFNSVLKNKPVTIITSSLAFTGGVRAQHQLRETLTSLPAHVVPGPEVVGVGVHTKFQDEAFLDQPTLDFMLSSLDRLRSEVVLRKAANAALQAAAR